MSNYTIFCIASTLGEAQRSAAFLLIPTTLLRQYHGHEAQLSSCPLSCVKSNASEAHSADHAR